MIAPSIYSRLKVAHPKRLLTAVASLPLLLLGALAPFGLQPLLHAQEDAHQAVGEEYQRHSEAPDDDKAEKKVNATRSVVFQGLRTVTEAEARKIIEFQLDYVEQKGVSPARADDAAFFLETALRDRGYDDAEVHWEIGSGNRILLQINEGGLLRLSKVVCHGNLAITDEGLFELLTSDTTERLGLDQDDPIPYVTEDIRNGRNHVKDFYDLLGYVGAEVTLLEPQIDPDPPGRRATVKLKIDEGKIYRVGQLDLGEPPEPALADEFTAILADYQDELFSPSLASQIQARLRDEATDAGYYEAKVTVTARDPVDSGGDFVRVDLDVTEANYGRKFIVRQLNLTGNKKVVSRYFDRMFEDVTGQPYHPDEANQVVSDMLRTGAFRRVTAIPENIDEQAGTLDLNIEIEETLRQEVGIGAGFGTYEGAIVGFEYRHLNLRGLVHRLDSRIEVSQRGLTGQVKYTDPAFLWTDWQASGGLFGKVRANEGYSKIENGLRLEQSHDFHKRDSITVFAQGSYVDIFEADILQPFLGDDAYVDNFVGISYEVDHRNDPVQPRSGYYFQASNSVGSSALGGDFDYLRSTLKLSYHQPIGPTTVHLGARAGAITGFGGDGGDDDVLPIDLRFFGGGARSVRSFAERELGPRDPGNYPIGGEFYTTFNAEYEIPIVGPLSLAVFTDAGNLLYDAQDASLDEMHYAGGLGLRLNSPLGPLRIDYGHNLNRSEGEPTGAFHVGFGVAF